MRRGMLDMSMGWRPLLLLLAELLIKELLLLLLLLMLRSLRGPKRLLSRWLRWGRRSVCLRVTNGCLWLIWIESWRLSRYLKCHRNSRSSRLSIDVLLRLLLVLLVPMCVCLSSIAIICI